MAHFTWNSMVGKSNLSWKIADQWLPETGSKGEWLQGNFLEFWKYSISWLGYNWFHVYIIVKTYTGQLKWMPFIVLR